MPQQGDAFQSAVILKMEAISEAIRKNLCLIESNVYSLTTVRVVSARLGHSFRSHFAGNIGVNLYRGDDGILCNELSRSTCTYVELAAKF